MRPGRRDGKPQDRPPRTAAGRMLLLASVLVGVGVAAGIVWLLAATFPHAHPRPRRTRGLALAALLPGLAAGAAFHHVGRRVLERLGYPVRRQRS